MAARSGKGNHSTEAETKHKPKETNNALQKIINIYSSYLSVLAGVLAKHTLGNSPTQLRDKYTA